MSHARYSESSLSPRSGGSGGNSQGSTTPRGSFRNSREDLLNESYGSFGSNPDLRYNINDELDDWRHGVTRRGSYTNYKEGRLFSDVLDELEFQIRKAEDDSTSLIHDFNVIRNQHQSQSRRINDLVRGFEEARYTLDHMRTGRYRKRSHLRPGSGEDRDLRRESVESFGRRGSSERFERRNSIDKVERRGSIERMERRGSFDRMEGRNSFDRMEPRTSLDRMERKTSLDRMERKTSLDRMERKTSFDRKDRKSSLDRMERKSSFDRPDRRDSSDDFHGRREDERGYYKSDNYQRSPEREKPLKSKGSSRCIIKTTISNESQC